MKKLAFATLGFIVLIILIIYGGNDVLILWQSHAPSQSIGSIANGRLVNGKRLPSRGDNFVTYSRLGSLIGRNGVHHQVRKAIIESFDKLYQDYPKYRYMIGEASWLRGGRIKPHKTHQNGLSVDFMVPVVDEANRTTLLASHIFNKFGYGVEFDQDGKTSDAQIDFEAMAMHIYYLHQSCVANRIQIALVIFDPILQKRLYMTHHGKLLKGKIRFSASHVWIRHDEHYHINFSL